MPKRYIVKEYLDCERCGLCKFRREIVFGRGKIPADILFIGEAPGKTENMLGEPFVGQSGKLLDTAMAFACKLANLVEPPRYFITNVVACRPTNSKDGENREPLEDEVIACFRRLEKTYCDVAPKRVVFLGKVAQRNAGKAFPGGTALPHPAYILRKGGVESPEFRAFARDLSQVFKELSHG